MANQASPNYIKESQARAITYKVLCGIVQFYGEATVREIRAKYSAISRPWNLPYAWVSEESAIAYLNQGVQNGLLRYERRNKGVVTNRRIHGMADGAGYYIWKGSTE